MCRIGSLEYRGRLKLIQYQSQSWFAPVRVECNAVDNHKMLVQPDAPLAAAGSAAAQCTFKNNIDFAGGGKDGVPSEDPADCCRKCQADEQCMASTWVPNSCWMKFSADQPVPLPVSRNGTGCFTGKKPKPMPQSIVCTAANDSPTVCFMLLAVP